MISFHSINLLKLQIITTQFKIFIVVEAISLPRTATCRPYTMSIRKDLYIMKATGIVCRIDNLGRIVIPKENRRPGGFSKYVTQQISMMSNMRTYTENFGNIEKRNALYAQHSSKPESVHTHMVAIDCTWSQRAYSASIYGFYCGYHGAMCIIDEVMPLPFSSAMNTRKTVAMTSRFGFVRSAGYSM